MAEEKKTASTMKELEQSMIDLGIRLCSDFGNGRVINDGQAKVLDAIIKLYSVVKVRDAPKSIKN